MARKKVFFNALNLHDEQNNLLSHRNIRGVYQDIFNRYGIQCNGYKSLDLSFDEENKITLDILRDNTEYLFCRVGKKKENNQMLVRDYDTYDSDNVLTPEDARRKGVEIFTYFLLNYTTGIFAIVSAQSAPNEKIINRILSNHTTEFTTEIINIPNRDSVRDLYQRGSFISKVTMKLPIPNAQILEEVFELDENQILNILQDDIRSLTLVVQGEPRRPLTTENNKIQNVINTLINARDEYEKASVRGKAPNQNVQDFNLKEQLFSYIIDVRTYSIENGEKKEYTIDELADEFFENLREAYVNNRQRLVPLVDRN